MSYDGPLKMGTAVLVGGTKTISDTSILSTSKVFVSNLSVGGTIGILSVSLNAGVGFTINSANVLDTSTIAYEIRY